MAKVMNVDFSNVKEASGINKRRIPAGDYLGYVSKVTDGESSRDGVFQYEFVIKLKNQHTQSAFPYYCKLQDNQLWKLRNLLVAAGLQVAKSKVKVDPNRVINRPIGVTIGDTEYEGKPQSEVVAIFPASELGDTVVTSSTEDDDTEDDDIEEAFSTAEEEVEDEVEEEPEPGPYDALSRIELRKLIAERGIDIKVYKSTPDEKLREALVEYDQIPVDEEVEEEEEEEPTPPPPPAPTRRRRKPAARPAVTDDDLDELDIDMT